jgi:hypothetical protein
VMGFPHAHLRWIPPDEWEKINLFGLYTHKYILFSKPLT